MILRRRQAVDSIIEQATWIATDNPEAAARFLNVLEETFLLLEQNPEMGCPFSSKNRRLAQLREWPVKGFSSILVFYRPCTGGIEIIDVIHGARDLPSIVDVL